jgi:hypothetical protein
MVGGIHMALNGTAYAVDLGRLRAAFGSRDSELLGRIVGDAAKAIESFDLQEGEPPSFSMRQAITDLIDGEFRAPERSRFLYGYAIEILCEYFGEVIPVPDDEFDEIGDPDDLEIDTPLLNGELPLPVPAWGDTPYVRFLTAEQVAEEYQRLSEADLSHDNPSIEEGRQALVYQLKWALDRGRAFVTVANG